ncbi:hypothetical protein D3C71_2054320 [compost metagenome]
MLHHHLARTFVSLDHGAQPEDDRIACRHHLGGADVLRALQKEFLAHAVHGQGQRSAVPLMHVPVRQRQK